LIVCVGWIGLGKERRQGLSLEGNWHSLGEE
jgi:hypothetical protein